MRKKIILQGVIKYSKVYDFKELFDTVEVEDGQQALGEVKL